MSGSRRSWQDADPATEARRLPPAHEKPETIAFTATVTRVFACTEPFSAGELRLSHRTRRLRPDLPSRMLFRLLGTMPTGAVQGVGQWPAHHTRYGDELLVTEVHQLVDGSDAIYRRIGEVRGIGPRTVQRIRERYGEGIVEVLDAPQRQSSLATVISRRRAATIAQWWIRARTAPSAGLDERDETSD